MNNKIYQGFGNSGSGGQGGREDNQRVDITAICEVRQGMAEWRRVTLDELSPGGFRINRYGEADPSQPLRIRIPGLQMLSARVVWQKDGAIGCAFAAPLHDAVFAHITRNLTR
ncbi:PilZ domain-containing protein [Novosphingobium sp. KACC 22771]|uniref:PilZ domain-containing protein n=1 Tax=Novosphingobium sp. KACC 22771 TaxID=3025670 RepID=UPI002365A45F|nr:PilZ domain-containing protein [Novosphingobium sp. KACC 22771]WDF71581.1 PilZ domain-containing protein [Novosphingobium sp. KACC 22771]